MIDFPTISGALSVFIPLDQSAESISSKLVGIEIENRSCFVPSDELAVSIKKSVHLPILNTNEHAAGHFFYLVSV